MSPEDNNDTKKFLSWGAISFLEATSSSIMSMCITILFFTVIASIALSFFIEIHVTTRAVGQINSLVGVKDAVANSSGQLLYLNNKEGDFVKKDQVIGVIRLEETNEAQVKSYITFLEDKLGKLRSDSFSQADLALGYEKIAEPILRSGLIDIDKKLSAYFREKEEGRKNFLQEITPYQQRIAVLNKQLSVLNASKLREYLLLQKQTVEEERGRLLAQIAGIENNHKDRLFAQKQEAENGIQTAIANAKNLILMHEIRSPADGRVAKLKVNPGATVKELQGIAAIVPNDAPLVAELFVQTRDIAKVALGYTAFVNIDAYPAHKYGYFSGKVISIEEVKSNAENPESASAGNGYLVRLEIDTKSVTRHPASIVYGHDAIRLVPGMSVSASIVSRTASIISLAFDKIYGNMD